MQNELYPCPYNKACKCDMMLPCKGCEEFKPERGVSIILVPNNTELEEFRKKLQELEVILIAEKHAREMIENYQLPDLDLCKGIEYYFVDTSEIEAIRSGWVNPVKIKLPEQPCVIILKKRIRSALPAKEREY